MTRLQRSRGSEISLLRELWSTRAGSSGTSRSQVHAELENPGRGHQLDPGHETAGEQQDGTSRQNVTSREDAVAKARRLGFIC